MRLGALRLAEKSSAASGMRGIEALPSKRARTTVADIVSMNRELSPTCLYVLTGRSGVEPLKRLEDAKGRTVLAKTDGLSREQKKDLNEQGVSLQYVRETPGAPGLHGIQSHERYEGEKDELYGTKVLPYIVLNRKQAESVDNMARQLPEPVKDKPVVRPYEPPDPNVSALIMYRCLHGGC